jgi:hypothetical protein
VSNSFLASAKRKYGAVSDIVEVATGCRSNEKMGFPGPLLDIDEIIGYCEQMYGNRVRKCDVAKER